MGDDLPPARRLAYLDGLRAIAALMVFLIHSGAPALRAAGPIGNAIVDHGRYGVTVFFVVSAFSLCVSLSPAFAGEQVSWTAYFVRRFFRIAPLYYVVLAYVVVSGSAPVARDSYMETMLFHVTFANVVAPQFANDVISVEWSIAVEWGFYLLLPFLVGVCRHRYGVAALSIVAILLVRWHDDIAAALGKTFFENRSFSLLSHFYAFVVGMVVFLAVTNKLVGVGARRVLTGVSVALVIAMLVCGDTTWSGPMVAIVTCGAIVNAAADGMARRVLSWQPLVWIGLVSYSVYLLHIFVIGAFAPSGVRSDLGMICALAVTLAAASLTYFAIERPFRAVGRRIAHAVDRTPVVVAREPQLP